MSWSEKYKNANKTSEALLLLVNSVVDIITKQMGSDVKHINSLISGDNMEALKKRHPVISNSLREFTVLMTSLNNMTTNVSRIEYLRKSIALQASSSKSTKKTEYIKDKTEKFENYISNFIAAATVCKASLQFFAETAFIPGRSSDKSDDKSDNRETTVNSMQDVVNALGKGINKMETQTIQEVRAASKNILESMASDKKEGGSQLDDYLRELHGVDGADGADGANSQIRGGADEPREIVCGGSDETVLVMVDHVHGGRDSRMAKKKLIFKDLNESSFGAGRDKKAYHKEVIKPTLKSMYPNQDIKKLVSMKSDEILTYLRSLDKISASVVDVMKSDNINGWEKAVRKYIKQHAERYNANNVEFMSDNTTQTTVIERVQHICDMSKDLSAKLATVDYNIIVKFIQDTVDRVNLIDSITQVEALVNDYKSHHTSDVFKRTTIKNEIKQHTNTLCKLIDKMNRLIEKNNKLLVVVDMSNDLSVEQSMQKLMQIEQSAATLLTSEEKLWEEIAVSLNNLIKSWMYLISPKVVETCVNPVKNKIAIIVVLNLLSAMLTDNGRFADGDHASLKKDIQELSKSFEPLYIPGQGIDQDKLEKIINMYINP